MDKIYDIGVLLVKILCDNVDIILINPLKMGRTLNFQIIFFPWKFLESMIKYLKVMYNLTNAKTINTCIESRILLCQSLL